MTLAHPPDSPRMAGSLFTSKTHKSSKNLRKLSISSPLTVSPPILQSPTFAPLKSPSWTVILVAKYAFDASSPAELSLRRGDHVRLLERPGNGWLKVQLIHDIGEGIVPASFLEISVNDPHNPVSREWLNDFQTQASMRNRVASVKVKCAYLSSSNNYWYRMDAGFNSGRTTYCAMFYEDFVALHSMLLSNGPSKDLQIMLPGKQQGVPPNLRNPIKQEAAVRAQNTMVQGLDKFVQDLLEFAQNHSSNFLGDYIDNHCTRTLHVKTGEVSPSDETIASSLVRESLRLTSAAGPTRNNSFSPTAPLPPIQGQSNGRFEALNFSTNTPYQISNMKYSSYLNQSHSQGHIQGNGQSPIQSPTQGKGFSQIRSQSSSQIENLRQGPGQNFNPSQSFSQGPNFSPSPSQGLNISQSQSHNSSGQAKKLARSFSTRTTTSLNSVIESYALSSSDESDGEDEEPENDHMCHGPESDEMSNHSTHSTHSTHSAHSTRSNDSRENYEDVFVVFQAEGGPPNSPTFLPKSAGLALLEKRKNSYTSKVASFSHSSKTLSSEYGSESNASSLTASTDSREPRTPVLGHPMVHPSVKVLSEYDLSPLEPKKHQNFATIPGDVMPGTEDKFPWDALAESR